MIPDAGRFLTIKLTRAAMKDFRCLVKVCVTDYVTFMQKEQI